MVEIESGLEALQGQSGEAVQKGLDFLANNQIIETIVTIITNNWTLITGVVIAYVLFHVVKVGIKVVAAVLIVAVLLAVLTNLGIVPPIDDIVGGIINAVKGAI